MSDNFNWAFDLLMGHEGGYSNNPKDPGGETMWGITARVARAWGYSGPMKSLPRETAKQIAKTLKSAVANAEQYLADTKLRLMLLRPRADLPALRADPLLPHRAAEAMLARVRKQGIDIAIMNGGGLRAAIDAGPITMGEVLTVLPFQNTLATFELTGDEIVAALESGVSQVEDDKGRFPQVAGLRFTWDATMSPQSPGSKGASVS